MLDLKLSYQGKFMAKNGDLAVAKDTDLVERTIGLRLRTPNDYTEWPGVGLTRFAGKAPTTQLINEVKRAVYDAITVDGMVIKPVVDVQVNGSTLDCNIQIISDDLATMAVFNFRNGVVAAVTESDSGDAIVTDGGTVRATINKYLSRNLL